MNQLTATTIILCLSCLCTAGFAQQQVPCQGPNQDDFDFWVGSWDVFNAQTDSLVGHNEVKAILGNCVIEENWSSLGYSRGKSFNALDPLSGQWCQLWVDNFGSRIEFCGEKTDSIMELRGIMPSQTGIDSSILRFTHLESKGWVRQEWFSRPKDQTDQEYQKVFDGIYKPSSEPKKD
jgi:hypothetical protein